jgi:ribonucleotide reductase alpha subunit
MSDVVLSPLGEKIFLDRYSRKNPLEDLMEGNMVLYRDQTTGQKEIGSIVGMDTQGLRVRPRDLAAYQLSGDLSLRRDELDHPVESVAQTFQRVARGVAGADADLFAQFDSILGKHFIPAGRILESVGTGVNTTGMNCFVLPSPKDSREGIFSTLQQMAELMCKGGGVGINYSSLRPENSYVAGVNGRSSGAVSWLELFSYVTNLIIQGGSRRGAQMAMMADWHPDILKFVNLKRQDNRATGCNMSVVVSDKFMAAVEAGSSWDLRFPDTSHSKYNELWDGDLSGWENKGLPVVVWATIQASELWDTIVSSAHACAEPGLWFIDRANLDRPGGSKMVATNPCVTGDTMIATVERGPVSFETLAQEGKDVKIWSWDPEHKQACVRWMRRPHKTREQAELLEITFDSGLKLRVTPDHSLYTFRGKKVKARDLTVGKSVRAYAVSRHRDGQLRAHNGDSGTRYAHQLVWEATNGPIPTGYVLHHKNENPEDNRLENLELLTPEEHNRTHYAARRANGFQGHKNFPEVLQKARERELGVGNHKVVAICQVGPADVYNGMVEGTHTYVICDPEYRGASGDGVFSGIVSANCGEQGLPPFGVCNLGHLIMPSFVDRDFWGGGGLFNKTALVGAVRVAVEFLDRIVDVTHYPVPATKTRQMLERRIGLGTVGLGEALIRMGLRYGGKEAVELCDSVYSVIAEAAYSKSADLAQQLGPAPSWCQDTFAASGFGGRIRKRFPVLFEKVMDLGLRNVCLLTQAPTGTVGTMLGTSTGIEPYYLLEWQRNSRLGSHTERAKVLDDYIRDTGETTLPEYFVTAMDLDPQEHVAVQAAIQTWTDASISKTINCPKEWTVEQVGAVYKSLYTSGCKGGTVYRDGCRSEQVLEAVTPAAEKPKRKRRKYPTARPSVTASRETPGGTVHVHLTRDPDDSAPLEIFCDAGRSGSEVRALMEAMGRVMTLVLRVTDETPEERLAIMIGQLRGIGGSNSVGMGPNRVLSMPDGVAAALVDASAWSGDVAKIPEKMGLDVCPSCAGITLQRASGCENCASCGFSRC